MLADVVDYGEYRTGDAQSITAQTMLVKFAGALSGFFIGIGLTVVCCTEYGAVGHHDIRFKA